MGDGSYVSYCRHGGARSTGKHRSEVGQHYNINLRVQVHDAINNIINNNIMNNESSQEHCYTVVSDCRWIENKVKYPTARYYWRKLSVHCVLSLSRVHICNKYRTRPSILPIISSIISLILRWYCHIGARAFEGCRSGNSDNMKNRYHNIKV